MNDPAKLITTTIVREARRTPVARPGFGDGPEHWEHAYALRIEDVAAAILADLTDAGYVLTPPAESNMDGPTAPGPGAIPDSVVRAVLDELGWPARRSKSVEIPISYWDMGVDVARAAIEAWEATEEERFDAAFAAGEPVDPTAAGS